MRRAAVQRVMGPDAVVPLGKQSQRNVQLRRIAHRNLIELALERSEEPFDPPVHPWASDFTSFMPNPQQPQHKRKALRGERLPIVRANRSGPSKAPNRDQQIPRHRPRVERRNSFQCDRHPAAVIDDAKDAVHPVMCILLASQIETPAPIRLRATGLRRRISRRVRRIASR